jgi:polysaccharide biosynthesis transport protein
MNRDSDQIDHPFVATPLVDSPSKELAHNLFRLIRIARDRKETLVQALCVSVILGALYFAIAPRFYESSAKLLIVQRNNDQIPIVGDQVGSDNVMSTHQELVTSPIVVQAAIEHLLPEHRVDFQKTAPKDWSKQLARNLSAHTTRRTNIIEVRYLSLHPEAAAAVVNAVVHAYLQFVEKTHQGTATDVIRVLTTERFQLQQSLATKQHELQSYRQSKGQLAIKSDGHVVDPMIQRALRLNDALMTAQEERIELQSTLASVHAAVENSASLSDHLAAIEKVLGKEMLASALGFSPQDIEMVHGQERALLEIETELQATAPYYGQSHPIVIKLKERARNIQHYLAHYRENADHRIASLSKAQLGPTLVAKLQQETAEAQQKERQLLDSFDMARAEAARHSGDIVQLEMLEREVERLEKLHDILFNKIATVDIGQLQGPIQATVVQEPLPDDSPISPRLRLIAVATVFGAFLVGGLIAYVQDTLDDRFASPDDMSTQLGVPVLAMVRQLETLEGERLAGVHTYVKPTEPDTEPFRTLRTALTLQSNSTETIGVSSAEPGDGKTTVTVNLAVAYAQAGKKTLVIDADLRKPGLTARLALKGHAGVADVLASEEDPARLLSKFLCRTELAELDVLPAGRRLPNPAELLSGSRFVELLGWANDHYDQVIVDCPPVLAVSDAQIVGQLIDGAVLVVRPEKNHRRLVLKACESFFVTGCKVLGVVANGLSSNSGGGYGYGYGYGSGYGYGYGHDEVAEPQVEATHNLKAA